MKESWQTRSFRWFMNLHPVYRRTGGKVDYVSSDWCDTHLRLPLNRATRNYVGVIFGGSLYAAADPIYMLQLIKILGKDYVVWDKAAEIRFLRPGNQTLYAKLHLAQDFLDELRAEVAEKGETERHLPIEWLDAQGKAYARIEKVLYIARRDFYQAKRKSKA